MDKKSKSLSVPFFQVPNDIFEIGLTTSELSVYVYLFRCSNQGKQAFPSYGTIGKKTGLTRRSAIHIIQKLANRGLLIKKYRGPGRSNNFVIALPGSEIISPGDEVHSQNEGIVPLPGSEIDSPGSEPVSPAVVKDIHPIKNSFINNQEKEKGGSEVSDCRLSFPEYAARKEIDVRIKAGLEELILPRFEQKGIDGKLTPEGWGQVVKYFSGRRDPFLRVGEKIELYIKKIRDGKFQKGPNLAHFSSRRIQEILAFEARRCENG